VIRMNVAVRDKGQVVRREVELARNDVLCEFLADGKIAVKSPVIGVIAERQFNTLDQSFLVIERGEEDRRTELPFVEQVAGDPEGSSRCPRLINI
jgi:hypothetical protein